MRKIVIILGLFLNSVIHAQTHLQWSTPEVTPGSQVNDFKGITTDAHGNTYTINFTQNSSNQWFTYRFFCYNSSGVKMWQYDNDSCFTNCQDIYKNIIPLDNNGAIFIGTYNDLNGNYEVRIKRIDMNGNLLWQKYWSFPPLSPLMPLVTTLDASGNIVIGMSSFHIAQGENFAFAKFDTIAGNELWHFELPDQGPPGILIYETMDAIETDANNNIYISAVGGNALANIFRKYYFSISPAGNMNYFGFTNFAPFADDVHNIALNGSQYFYRLLNFSNDVVLFKQDTTGGFFSWTIPITHDSAVFQVLGMVNDSANFYVLSNFNYFFPDSSFAGGMWTNKHYCITKIDTAGNTLWQKDYFTQFDSLSFSNNIGGAKGMVLCNNNLYVVSDGLADTTSQWKMILHKIDSAGNTVWYDTTSLGPAGVMAADMDCNVYVSRSAHDVNNNFYYYCLTQKFSDVPLAVMQHDEVVDGLIVAPNPAHDQVAIQLKNKAHAFLYIHIYNSVGQRVYAETGDANKVTVPLKNLSDGIYVIESRTKQGGQFHKKIMVNKP